MRILGFVVLIFCCIDVCGQKLTDDQEAYNEGLRLLDEREYPDALRLFDNIVQKYPSSLSAAKAQFYVGYTAQKLNNLEKAKKAFLDVVNAGNAEIKRESKDADDPYPSKHWSARYLADMSIENQEWSEAERYIRMFDKDFPYQFCCDQSRYSYEIEKASMYARLHEGQGKIVDAINDFLPLALDSRAADYNRAVDRLSALLERNFSNEKVIAELEAALAGIDKKKMLTFFGAKVDLSKSFKSRASADDIRKSVRKNQLFTSFLGEPED